METPTTYAELVNGIIDIINIAIPVLFGGLFAYFIWKMVDAWILHGGDEKSVAEGKQYATVAVIVFVLMVSAWGIVLMLKSSFFG